MFINSCCYLQRREWLEKGWRALRTAAGYERDFLLPAPSTNCNGCLHAELRSDSAFAKQNRVLHSLQREKTSVFPRDSTAFWTPHSGRAFMPSGALALGVPREERDYLGGWSARGSDTYTRVAVRVVSNLQRLVNSPTQIHLRRRTPSTNLSAKRELHRKIARRASNSMERSQSRGQLYVNLEEVEPVVARDLTPDEEPVAEPIQREESNSSIGSDNPKEVRDHARRSLESGYYVSAFRRNATRILHFLGDCHMVPGIDYVRFQFMGHFMPSVSQFDGVCKLCSKKRSVHIHESSGTETSSSTSQGEI